LAVAAGLLTASHALVVAVALLLAEFFDYVGPLRECAVGISALLFALKAVLNQDPNTPPESNFYGMTDSALMFDCCS
jgi:hypothetical protein